MKKLTYEISALFLLCLSFTSEAASPIITLNGNSDTTINVYSSYQDEGATAIDAEDGNITAAIIVYGTIDTSSIGDYFYTYIIQDNDGNYDTTIRTIRVRDLEKPVINNTQANKTDSCWVVEVQLQSIFADITTATDNYNSMANGITLTATPAAATSGADVDTRFQGTTTVSYTATDSSGNVTTQCIVYVVKDYCYPKILHISDSIRTDVYSSYNPLSGISLSGGCDSLIVITHNVDTAIIGFYSASYVLPVRNGGYDTTTVVVEVIDDLNPIITGKNGAIIKILKNTSYNPADYIILRDNYDAPSDLRDSLVIIFNDVDVSIDGLYTTAFRTTDISGNVSNEFTLYTEVGKETNLSVSDLEASNLISVYPNPTKSNITIQMKNSEVIDKVIIYSILGTEMQQIANNSSLITLRLEGYAKGIYSVVVIYDDKIVTKRIMIE